MSAFDRDLKTEERNPKRSAGFVAKAVLPGEKREDFDLLVADLWDQYDPEGPIEEDAVQTIAQAIWRKNHLDVFNRAFVARKRWGFYYQYPGDPDGPVRMSQENYKKIAVSYVEMLTTCATHFVDKRLAEGSTAEAVGQEAIRSTKGGAAATAADGDAQSDPAAQADDATADFVPDFIRGTVDAAVSEIDEINQVEKDDAAKRAKLKARIIKGAVERKIEAEKESAKSNRPVTDSEQIEVMTGLLAKLAAVLETAFGVGFVEETFERIGRQCIEHELASFGDLLAPDGYISELEFVERLDATIERAHKRLMKYQAERIKKSATKIASLQPGWAARKR